MLTKDKAAGLGTAAAQRNASHAHCTTLAKRRLNDGYCEGRLSFELVRRAFRQWPWLREA